MSMNCFSEQVEFSLIDVSDDVYNEILKSNKGSESIIAKQPFRYCKINELFSVTVKETNEGTNMYQIRIYKQEKKGEWIPLQYCEYRTVDLGKIPEKVIFENSTISVLAKNGLIVNKFDVTGWIDEK